MIDQTLRQIAILSIRLYQLIGRPFFRRTCLFHPTCSRRALHHFQQHKFKKALHLTRQQLSECKGTYSLRLDPNGQVEMITISGAIVPENEINPQIANRLKQFSPISKI